MKIDKSFRSPLSYFEHFSSTKLKRNKKDEEYGFSVFSECLPLNGTYTLIFINHQQT